MVGIQGEIILQTVRCYCKYDISYRELQEMLVGIGVILHIYSSWHIDETYVKVNGRWAYLYRTVDQRRYTIDF